MIGLSMARNFAGQPDPVWGFGLGGTVFIASLAMFWGGLHLRGTTRDRIRQDIDIALAGLSEEAARVLRVLQAELAALLPDPSEPFDPLTVIVDPARVESQAKRGIRILKQRDRLPRRFSQILVVCNCLKYTSVAFALTTLLATALYFLDFSHPKTWESACWLDVAIAVIGVLAVTAYSVLNSRIQTSFEAADPIEDLLKGVAK